MKFKVIASMAFLVLITSKVYSMDPAPAPTPMMGSARPLAIEIKSQNHNAQEGGIFCQFEFRVLTYPGGPTEIVKASIRPYGVRRRGGPRPLDVLDALVSRGSYEMGGDTHLIGRAEGLLSYGKSYVLILEFDNGKKSSYSFATPPFISRVILGSGYENIRHSQGTIHIINAVLISVLMSTPYDEVHLLDSVVPAGSLSIDQTRKEGGLLRVYINFPVSESTYRMRFTIDGKDILYVEHTTGLMPCQTGSSREEEIPLPFCEFKNFSGGPLDKVWFE